MPPCHTPAELSRALLDRLEEVLDVAPDVMEALCKPPDVVVHDAGMALPARFYALRHECPVVQTMTIFASNEHFSLEDKLTTIDGVDALPDPGNADDGAVDPAAVRYHERLVEFTERYAPPRNVSSPPPRTVVMLPRRFQPRAETFGDDHVFVGPSPTEDAGSWTPPSGDGPLAVLTVSTSSGYSPEFFRAIALGLHAEGWQMVMALGSKHEPDELGPVPPGVHVYTWLPIDAVLPHARLFVSQGGMGTVMAAARHAVPAVYVPHLPEPMANAKRAEELGLARTVPITEAAPEAVVAAARELTEDPELPARLADMREHAASGGGPVRTAAEFIDHAHRYGRAATITG